MPSQQTKTTKTLRTILAGAAWLWFVPGAPAAPADDAAGTAMIATWNLRALQFGFAEDQLRTFKTHRALALTHLAMHDAWNATDPRYASFVLNERDPQALGAIAAVQAAHDVLAALYPKDGGDLDLMLAQDLAAPLRGVEANIARTKSRPRTSCRGGDARQTVRVTAGMPPAITSSASSRAPTGRRRPGKASSSSLGFDPPARSHCNPRPVPAPTTAPALESGVRRRVRRSAALRRRRQSRPHRRTNRLRGVVDGVHRGFGQPPRSLPGAQRKTDPRTAAGFVLERGDLRRLHRGLGQQVRIRPPAPGLGDRPRRGRRQRRHPAGGLLAAAAHHATLPRLRLGTRHRVRGGFRDARPNAGRRAVHDGDEQRPSRDAQPQFLRFRRRRRPALRPLAHSPGLALPLRRGGGLGARPQGRPGGARTSCSRRSPRPRNQPNGSSTTSAATLATSTGCDGTRRWRTVRPMGPRRSDGRRWSRVRPRGLRKDRRSRFGKLVFESSRAERWGRPRSGGGR